MSHSHLLFQEKRSELNELNQKVDGMQQVEQWQVLQDVYGKLIAWETVQCFASACMQQLLQG